jgi:hypothetical protein
MTVTRRAWPLVLLLFVLAGCQGSDSGARVAAAAEATLEEGSANFTINQEITGGAAGGQTVTSEGALDFEGQRGRVTSVVPDPQTGAGTTEVETIFDGNLIYLRLPEGIAPTPWVRVDLDNTEGIPGLEQVDQFNSDPSQSFSFLEGIAGEIEQAGEEDVRGAPATHYTFTVDLEQAAEAVDEEQREYVQQQIEALGVTELPMDLWLDAEDRIVRQSYVLDLADIQAPEPEGAALEGEVETTIEYFDFGTDVAVEAPPEDQVTDFAELVEGVAEQSSEGG